MKISVIIFIFSLASNCQSRELDIPDGNLVTDNNSFNHYRARRGLKAVDYCTLNCKTSGENIGCIEKGDCSTAAPPCELLKPSATDLVKVHNELRNQFATGNDPRASSVKVSNMMALKWNDDLAFLAACNLKRCPAKTRHDYCHITVRFPAVGQNIAWSKGIPDCIEKSTSFVHSWYDQISLLTTDQIKQMGKEFYYNHGTDHFTQVIWARSTHVGCALTSKNSDGSVECMLTCNYGPTGNVIGMKMYQEGNPSSECPKHLQHHRIFSGLCAKGRSIRAVKLIFAPLLLLLIYL